MLILVKVARWFAASLKLTAKMMKIVPNPKQGTFSGCFGLFFPHFLKTRIFPDI